jgi:hydrogenase nickel incorporation protein HypA/HybF
MHELAVCQALLEKVETIALQHAATVNTVRLSVGPLSGVEPALLQRAYPLACAGTAAQGSRLVIESVPVRVRCRICDSETAAQPNRLLCASCGDWLTDLVAGDDLLLISVELNKTSAVLFPASVPVADLRAGTAPGGNDV